MSKHVGQILVLSQGYDYRATCSCGWQPKVVFPTLPLAAVRVRTHTGGKS